MTQTIALPSTLPLAHQRIISNELFIEIKEGNWKRARATRTTTPGKPPPHRSIGAHSSADSDHVRQRLTETLWDERFIRILIPPETRFEFPPTAVQMYKAAYDTAMTDLEGDGMLDAWHRLLAGPARQVFRPAKNKNGNLRMRRNDAHELPEEAIHAITAILAYATIIHLPPETYDHLAAQLPATDLASIEALAG